MNWLLAVVGRHTTGPTPIPYKLYRQCSDSTEMTVGQLGFFVPLVERSLDKAQFPLTRRVVTDVQAAALQAANHISGDDKRIFSHIAEYPLSGHTAEAAASNFQQAEQLNQVLPGPAADKFAETSVLTGDVENKLGIGLYAQYLLAVADNAGVLCKAVDLVRAEHEDFLRGETKEHVLKIVPFAINHTPHEAGLKDATGHLGQPAVVLASGQRSRAAH